MQVVVLQLDLVWHDRAANHAKAREALLRDPPAEGDLVVLPEGFPVGFSMKVDEIADRDDSTGRFLGEIAREFGVTVVGGNMVKPDDRGRNVAIVASPGGHIIGRYEKLHPFSYSGESNHYRGGDHLTYFQWNGATVSPLICYDLRFPEAFRIATRGGAEIFILIANWPAARVHHWVTLLTARAIENQAYVIGCNRVGSDPNVAYPGRSLVIDPRGQIVADAGDKEGVLKVEIDLQALRKYRADFPALADMRFVPERLV